jgi:hypothetical protein
MCILHAVARSEMIHKVDLTGDYETNVYDAARRLLAAGADPVDTVETYRGGKPSMTAVIGEAAKWAPDVSSMKLRRWKAPLCRETALPAAVSGPAAAYDGRPPDDVATDDPRSRNDRHNGPCAGGHGADHSRAGHYRGRVLRRAGRLALGRVWSAMPPIPVAKAPEPTEPRLARIVADRLFEGDPVPDGMPHRPRMQFTVQRWCGEDGCPTRI